MDFSALYLDILFENPFVLASAPPTANGDMIRRAFDAGWAGAVIKTLTEDSIRHPQNRFASCRSANRIVGFENLELLSEIKPDKWYLIIKKLKTEFPNKIIIASIMADTRSNKGWISLAKGCQDAGADMLELNFSCPHGYPEKGRGAAIGQSSEYSSTITGWIKDCKDITIPIIPKLTAAVADIQYIGQAVAKSGADGISAINTIPSFFGIDLQTLRPKPDINGLTAYGGYSGYGIKPIALRAVASLCQSPGLPVMACGGITNGFDAVEFMLLGAPVTQVCTEVMLRGYGIVKKMQDQLKEFMELHNFTKTSDFIGRCKDLVVPYTQLNTKTTCCAVLKEKKCTRCGSCFISCRDGGYQAITLSDDALPVINSKLCAGCSLCKHVCPVDAITMCDK